jgi:hypothetical protein
VPFSVLILLKSALHGKVAESYNVVILSQDSSASGLSVLPNVLAFTCMNLEPALFGLERLSLMPAQGHAKFDTKRFDVECSGSQPSY